MRIKIQVTNLLFFSFRRPIRIFDHPLHEFWNFLYPVDDNCMCRADMHALKTTNTLCFVNNR